MSSVSMRPTFLLETKLSDAEVMRRIREMIDRNTDKFRGQFTRDHAMICIDESRRHFWSPWMNIEIRSSEVDDRQQVFGRFSPHPSIWTAIMFSYLSIGVLIFFAVMFGCSMQLAGQSPWAYFFIPPALIVAVILWIASKAGQKLAHEEMRQMKAVIEDCIKDEPGRSSIDADDSV